METSDSHSLLRIHSSLALIGKTPMVRLTRLEEPGCGQLWAKCEQFNPGGSVKDRIALAMIEAAESNGSIEPGHSTIVEPTSGNTGIGLAIVCAAKGYDLILTMPESMSLERRALLQSYGAKIIPTAAKEVMAGAMKAAVALCTNDAMYMPDQFSNPANPAIHRDITGPEMLAQLSQLNDDKPISAFVSAVGTGGTITGVGQAIRKVYPGCQIVAVEPARSAVLSGDPAGPHKIQGIGAGFVPAILDRSLLSSVRTVLDIEAYRMKTRLASEQGLLVGISSGANVVVAATLARELGPASRVVTVLCDTGERYFSLDTYFQRPEPIDARASLSR